VHATHMLRSERRNSASTTRTTTSGSQTLPSIVVLEESCYSLLYGGMHGYCHGRLLFNV
jgi:hypothetical protein